MREGTWGIFEAILEPSCCFTIKLLYLIFYVIKNHVKTLYYDWVIFKPFKTLTVCALPFSDVKQWSSLKADFQSSHEAPRSSLRVLTSN
jgi:hypothetical protein